MNYEPLSPRGATQQDWIRSQPLPGPAGGLEEGLEGRPRETSTEMGLKFSLCREAELSTGHLGAAELADFVLGGTGWVLASDLR